MSSLRGTNIGAKYVRVMFMIPLNTVATAIGALMTLTIIASGLITVSVVSTTDYSFT